MTLPFEKYRETADFLLERLERVPDTVVVLGSGLGEFAEGLQNRVEVDYRDIPNFPASTVVSHKGVLHRGSVGEKEILVMQGRFHCYEGYTMEQAAFWVRALRLCGVKYAILTNAAGAINESFSVGDLMLIRDHIKFCAESPVAGRHEEVFGERFFDMSDAYSAFLSGVVKESAQKLGIALREGVYAFMAGPQFETPAEIRALKILGADAVGMSTVYEVISAAQCGMKVAALSILSNMAAGVSDKPLSDKDINEAAKLAGGRLFALLGEVVSRL